MMTPRRLRVLVACLVMVGTIVALGYVFSPRALFAGAIALGVAAVLVAWLEGPSRPRQCPHTAHIMGDDVVCVLDAGHEPADRHVDTTGALWSPIEPAQANAA